MPELAPIILFTYNRPVHTRRTLESLAANALAAQSHLFVFSDGPKDDQSRSAVEKVRAVIRERAWCGEVTIIESPENRGLAASIVHGVTSTLDSFGKVIVLEDDLLLSPGFLTYMNDALIAYEDEPSVMHISGYMFPVAEGLPETFHLHLMACWGWATWKRAFQTFNSDTKFLLEAIDDPKVTHRFNIDGAYDYRAQLVANVSGAIHTWAIKWYATIFLRGGLSLFPHKSLVENFGHDASGTHCDRTGQFHVPDLAPVVSVQRQAPRECLAARTAIRDCLKPRPRGRFLKRMINRLRQLKTLSHAFRP